MVNGSKRFLSPNKLIKQLTMSSLISFTFHQINQYDPTPLIAIREINCNSSSKMNPSVCPPELRPGDREPADSVPQAERFRKEPSELHPGPAEGGTL